MRWFQALFLSNDVSHVLLETMNRDRIPNSESPISWPGWQSALSDSQNPRTVTNTHDGDSTRTYDTCLILHIYVFCLSYVLYLCQLIMFSFELFFIEWRQTQTAVSEIEIEFPILNSDFRFLGCDVTVSCCLLLIIVVHVYSSASLNTPNVTNRHDGDNTRTYFNVCFVFCVFCVSCLV